LMRTWSSYSLFSSRSPSGYSLSSSFVELDCLILFLDFKTLVFISILSFSFFSSKFELKLQAPVVVGCANRSEICVGEYDAHAQTANRAPNGGSRQAKASPRGESARRVRDARGKRRFDARKAGRSAKASAKAKAVAVAVATKAKACAKLVSRREGECEAVATPNTTC